MSKFENVSVIKKANVYFDGKVSSRTVLLGSGEAKTLGFMQPGEFVFDTNQKECMELLAGQWDILLPGE
ncbi:pyrimidine/purine nucleoside phosphorylase, partial [Salmonella enterica]|nr:pyrimidine/purine nucleoside phosphorylase [Salmonella enterica]